MGGIAMINSSNLPQYKTVFYRNNPQTGFYTKTEQQPEITHVMRLPYECIKDSALLKLPQKLRFFER